MPQAICAASMAIVPEPQHGSCSAPPSLGRAAPAGGGEHRRGERLLQRRVALVLAPAALEQRLARAVDVERGALGADVQHERQVGAARVDARPLAGCVAQRVADGVLDAQRGEVEALQRRCAARWCRRAASARGVIQSDQSTRARQRVEVVLVAVAALGDLDTARAARAGSRG